MTSFGTLTCLYCLCLLGVPFMFVFMSIFPQLSGGWTVNLYLRSRHETEWEPSYVRWWVSPARRYGALEVFLPLRDSQSSVLGLRGAGLSASGPSPFCWRHVSVCSHCWMLITFMRPLTCVHLWCFLLHLSFLINLSLSFIYTHCSVRVRVENNRCIQYTIRFNKKLVVSDSHLPNPYLTVCNDHFKELYSILQHGLPWWLRQ